MPIRRHFLGWDGPLTAKVGKFLLSGRTERPVSLEGTLVVVPTRQAGRRLRQALAMMCAERDTALLSANIVPPTFFLNPVPGSSPDAGSTVIRAAWAEVLMTEKPGTRGGLIPDSAERRDPAWAMRLGDSICRLRDDLAEGGHTIKTAAAAAADAIEEPDRWADLARLETRYLARIAELKLGDPCERKIRQAVSPPAGFCGEFKRIVLASVPDPMPLALKVLEKIADRIPVDVLVWADESSAGMFDEWGRPLPEEWERAELDVPDVILAGSPVSQAKHAMDRIAALPAGFGPRDLAIGVPDRSVIPLLESELEDCGLTGFDPSERPLRDHPIYRLLAGFCALATGGRYAAVSGFLRHADVLQALSAAHGVQPARVLAELDEFRNERLPTSLSDFKDLDDGESGALKTAIEFASGFVAAFEKEGIEPAVRQLLQCVYGPCVPKPHSRESREFERAAEKVAAALGELAEVSALPRRAGAAGPALADDKAGMADLLLGILEGDGYHADRHDEQVDLDGWLELPWNDAPALIVTGMNDGIVPSSTRGDQFLPNSLRRKLGLRDDGRRAARDAYFLRGLVESRRQGGHVCFIVGKTGAAGEPLRPSRLLFRCPDDRLVERASLLFAQPRPERAAFPPTISFKLNARLPPDMPADAWQIKRMGATMFRDYLACPFRFYLKHVLKMEEVDDSAHAPDELQFGTLVHAVLEAMGRDETVRACDDEQRIRAFLHAEAGRQAERLFGNRPSLSVAIALDTAIQRLSRAAQVQARLAGEGWEIVKCEEKRTMTIGGVAIVGKLDRIDRHRDTGAVRVLDYKTSDRNEEPASMHLGPASAEAQEYARVEVAGKTRRWLDLQLPIYMMMAAAEKGAGTSTGSPRARPPGPGLVRGLEGEAVLSRGNGANTLDSAPFGAGAEVEVGYFVLPKAVSETGLSLWPGLGGELLQSARACAEGVVADIRSGRFWPPSAKTPYADDFARLFNGAFEDCVDVQKFPFKNGKEEKT